MTAREPAPLGAVWQEAIDPYLAMLVCVVCGAPWHVACGVCAMESHDCKLERVDE